MRMLTSSNPKRRPGKSYQRYDELPKVAQAKARRWAKTHGTEDGYNVKTKAGKETWARKQWWSWTVLTKGNPKSLSLFAGFMRF